MSTTDQSFADIVAQEFAYIRSTFGLLEVARDSRSIRFESAKVYLIVIHTPYDEVEVSFGRLSDEAAGQMGFCVFDVLYAVDQAVAKQWRAPTANTPDRIASAVKAIVSIFQLHGQNVLSGDRPTYESLATTRTERLELYQVQTVATRVRPEAEAAFSTGDYETAARLYRSIDAILSDVERKKLAFAEKKS